MEGNSETAGSSSGSMTGPSWLGARRMVGRETWIDVE